MNLVFAGTPEFAVPALKALLDAGHTVLAVYTQPDRPAGRGRKLAMSPVKEFALARGLAVHQPATLRTEGEAGALRALHADAMIVIAYGLILPPPILAIPKHGCINVHASLLPRWRGAAPIQRAIEAGDTVTGVTIMLMDAGMDSGPILAQRTHAIDPEDTAGTLSDRLSALGADLLGETLPRWLRDEIEPRAQDPSQATTTSLLRKEDGAIDWAHPAAEIWRRVRACNPWPGAYTYVDGKLLHIWRAWPADAAPRAEPGTVISLTPEQRVEVPDSPTFAVQAGEGLLAVREAQRAGRRALPADEFLRGMPDLIGKRLG